MLVFIVLVASYDLLLGYTGIVSFAHTMFFGIGAYGVAIASLRLGERVRDRSTLATASWRDRTELAERVTGLSLARGVSAALLERLGGAEDDRPVLDGLLMVAPALIQCVAALSDTWPVLAAEGRWVVGMGGHPDSCYMWRTGGALQRAREAEGGLQPKRP